MTQIVLLVRRRGARVPTYYPRRWTSAQCRSLQRFAIVAGLSLIPLWLILLAFIRWPFQAKDVFALGTFLMMTQMRPSLLTLTTGSGRRRSVISCR